MPWVNAATYTQKVQALNPIAYWPMAEPSGTTALDASGNGRTGTYSGVTLGAAGIGDGCTAATFVPASSSRVALHSVSLANAFNGAAGTLMVWAKVSSAAVWADGVARYMGIFLADANNQLYIRKNIGASAMQFVYIAGSTTEAVVATYSGVDWTHFAITWDKAAEQVKAYTNGVQTLTTQTALGIWAGTPVALNTVLGATSTTGSAAWDGTLAHAALFGVALTPAQIATLATVGPANSAAFLGDSRTQGTGWTYPQIVRSQIGNTYVLSNFGTSGWTMLQVGDNAAAQLATVRQLDHTNVAVIWAGVNDAHAGFDATTIYTRTLAACANARAAGYKVVLCTEIDDQSALGNAASWHTVIWPALNTLIRGDTSKYDRLADLGADARLQNALDTTYFNADAIHLNAAGQSVAAGIVAAQIATL